MNRPIFRPLLIRWISVIIGSAGLLLQPGLSPAQEPAEAVLKRMVQNQKGIQVMLSAWAQDHDGIYPDEPLDANTNFRLLYVGRLLEREKPFVFPGDGLVEQGKPDENIGSAPGFLKALEPGELSIAYVAGLDEASHSSSPMLVSGAGHALGWITGVDKTPPREPFRKPVIVTTVNGATKVYTPDPDGKIREMKNGKRVDIFSAEYGTNPDKIRLPAAVPDKKS